MAILLAEGLETKIALLPEIFHRLTSDVATGVAATPDVNQSELITDFVEKLRSTAEYERRKFCPGGAYYETFKDFKGSAFTGLPFRSRYEMVAQTDTLTHEQRDNMAVDYVNKVYGAYHAADRSQNPAGSQRAWEVFIGAYQRYNAYTTWDNKSFIAGFPSKSRFYPHQTIYLPCYDRGRYELDETDALRNSELQTQLGRATGILLPDETLTDFIQRSSIKDTMNGDETTQPGNEGKILAEANDWTIILFENQYRTRRAKYSNIPLERYPGSRATLSFDSSRTTGGLEGSLVELISKGSLTPSISLEVPLRAMLSIDKLR